MIRFIIMITLALLPISERAVGEPGPVEKTECISSFGFSSVNEARRELLLSAKRSASQELFGEVITSSTTVRDFVLSADEIRSASIGLIRVIGSARFFNGVSLGELCVSIVAHATDADFKKFEPVLLLSRACLPGADLTAREVREATRLSSRFKAVRQYEPLLEEYDAEQVVPLLKRWEVVEEGFIPDTDTYCAQISGEVIPIEVIAFSDFNEPKPVEKIEETRPNVSGTYVGRYNCGGQIVATFTLTTDTSNDIVGVFKWASPSGRIYGEVDVFGLFDIKGRRSNLQITRWNQKGGGNYYGSIIMFSEDFSSFYAQHRNLKNCDATYVRTN